MKALLEKVSSAGALPPDPISSLVLPPWGSYQCLQCDSSRYLQSSSVWTPEPWQRWMWLLWSSRRRSG